MKKHYTIEPNRIYIILGKKYIHPVVCMGEQALKEYEKAIQIDDTCTIYQVEMLKELPYMVDLNEV